MLGCGLWAVGCGLWAVGCGLWAVGCGLWGERSIRSVAHLTRADGQAFFEAIRQAPPRTEVRVFPLEQANEALEQLRRGAFQGAAVLRVAGDEAAWTAE